MFNQQQFNLSKYNVGVDVILPYEVAINMLERYIVPIVEIYFDGLLNPPAIFEGNQVDSISLLEELKAGSDKVFGTVSSNEVVVQLNNSSRNLSPSNANGSYYGKMLPKTPIKVYLKLKAGKSFYYTDPLGIFFSGEWDDQSNLAVVAITAHDIMYFLGTRDVTSTRIIQSLTAYAWFEILFSSIGLLSSDYVIDASLSTYVIAYHWLTDKPFKEQLAKLAEACNAFVYVNRIGKIEVKVFDTNISITNKLTEYNQLYTVNFPTSYFNAYSGVEMHLYQYADSIIQEEVANIPSKHIDIGETTYKYTFDKQPISDVTEISIRSKIRATNTTRLINAHMSATEIELHLLAPTDWDNVDILISGFVLQGNKIKMSIENPIIKGIIGSHIYSVNNAIMQDATKLTEYMAQINALVSNVQTVLKASIRGNPRIYLGSLIEVEDVVDSMGLKKMYTYRNQITFAGGLSQEIEGYNIV